MRAATVIVAAGSLTGIVAGVSAAQASTPASMHKKMQVVKVVSRAPFGKMLATKAGRSLYYMPTGTCRGECLSIWPPLVLRKGSTVIPTGTKCLGTAKFAHLRQITYRGHRLYKFADDSGTSVTGNGEAGFLVAKVSNRSCPR